MKILTKTLLAAVSLTGLFAGTAYADDPAPDFTVSGYAALTSDYRFRGISQNDKGFAPQGSLNVSGPDGFYGGTWLSKTDWGIERASGGANDPSLEADWYIGKHTDLGGTDLNVEAYYYSYPDFHPAVGNAAASYYETIVQLTHAFGPLTLTGTVAMSPSFSLGGGDGWYIEGTGAYAITDWLSVSANVGHQWVDAAPSDYTHFDVGATATWHSWTLDGRYASTDIGNVACTGFWMGTKNACSGGFVATITYNVLDLLK